MSPKQRAAALAAIYLAFSSAWILGTSSASAAIAGDVVDLRQLEVAKGLFFVGMSAVLFYGTTSWMFVRLERGVAKTHQLQVALVRAEARAQAGLLAASIAHDFKNMLSVIDAGHAWLIPRVWTPEEQEVLGDMGEAVLQARDLAARLSSAARARPDAASEELGARAVLEEVGHMLSGHGLVRGCALRLEVRDDVLVRGEREMLRQIATNLILNAAGALDGEGAIEIRSHVSGERVVLEFHDDGPGFSAEAIGKAFDPFFTTKPDGTGLGLYSVRACAQMMGGGVVLGDSPLGGACVRVFLPGGLARPAVAHSAPVAALGGSTGTKVPLT